MGNKKNDKRNGPDFLNYWIKVSSFIVWLLLGISLFLADMARPETQTILDTWYGKHARTFWDESFLYYALIISVILFVFTVISLIINSRRLKRAGDHLSYSLLISLFISIVTIIIYSMFLFDIL